ncbi:HAD-IIIA family hydrolase [Luteimicrobium sp. NPDC057192]|uniref:HAD-IIIA family hydrolase n=1 Tax=Luteimicrobium sp. NPDC057192 TaxID=3346042 RepID=UPI00363F7C38
MSGPGSFGVVVPTVGRPSLDRLLDALAASVRAAEEPGPGGQPLPVVLADDRRLDPRGPLPPALAAGPYPGLDVRVVRSGGRGPAAARNAGWRTLPATRWVVFLDDDVLPPQGWAAGLRRDLAAAGARTGGVQGRIEVPLDHDGRPTDWERVTQGLERAAWATADMAYRRDALVAVGGFDERFPRAYREDADLALRVRGAGWELATGARVVRHPVRPADDAVSLRVQAGTRDDALMRALHGPAWRRSAETGRGLLSRHAWTVGAATAGIVAAALRRPHAAATAAGAWLALTGWFLGLRLAPGPRPGDPRFSPELRRMAWTSALIPFAAVAHRVAGSVRVVRQPPEPWPPRVRAVLFDRDGTLVHDVPYNDDPARVVPVSGAREVLDDLRARGILVGVVSNQSGVGRGLVGPERLAAVDARVAGLLGPFDTWQVCPHAPGDGCACRKPAPGLVLAAARDLGLAPAQCAVVGDIGSDVAAAVAAGAPAVLVPTPVTEAAEVAAAPCVAATLDEAVAALGPVLAPAPAEGVR